jgi:hypothetical protein
MERRYLKLDRVAVSRAKADAPPVIAGHAARFYDESDPDTEFELYADRSMRVVERISPGAFARAVEEDDCRALFNHSADMVLGRCSAGTLRLKEDAKGLRYEIDPPDTQLARDLMQSIARGDITGSSFCFDVDGEDFSRSKADDGSELIVRHVRAAKLYDVGPVTFPAYGGATAGVRAATAVDVEALLARVNRQVRGWTPEACQAAARARVRAMEMGR